MRVKEEQTLVNAIEPIVRKLIEQTVKRKQTKLETTINIRELFSYRERITDKLKREVTNYLNIRNIGYVPLGDELTLTLDFDNLVFTLSDTEYLSTLVEEQKNKDVKKEEPKATELTPEDLKSRKLIWCDVNIGDVQSYLKENEAILIDNNMRVQLKLKLFINSCEKYKGDIIVKDHWLFTNKYFDVSQMYIMNKYNELTCITELLDSELGPFCNVPNLIEMGMI